MVYITNTFNKYTLYNRYHNWPMTWQLIFYMERGGTIIVELKKWIAVSRDWYNILLEQILQEFGIMFLWWQHAFRIYLWIVEWSFLSECRLPFMFLIVMMTDVTFFNLPMPSRFTVKKEDFSHMGPPPVFPVWCQRRITFISTPWYLYLALHPPHPETPREDPYPAKALHFLSPPPPGRPLLKKKK